MSRFLYYKCTEPLSGLSNYMCTRKDTASMWFLLLSRVTLHNRDKKIKAQFLCIQYPDWEINCDLCGATDFKVIAFSTFKKRVQRTFEMRSVREKWKIFPGVTHACSNFACFRQKAAWNMFLYGKLTWQAHAVWRFQLPVLQFWQWNNESTVPDSEELCP